MAKNNKIDNIIIDKLKNLDEKPREELWKTIEVKLNSKKSNRKTIIHLILIYFLGVLSLAFYNSLFNISNKNVKFSSNESNKKDTNSSRYRLNREKVHMNYYKKTIKDDGEWEIYEECNTYKIYKGSKTKKTSASHGKNLNLKKPENKSNRFKNNNITISDSIKKSIPDFINTKDTLNLPLRIKIDSLKNKKSELKNTYKKNDTILKKNIKEKIKSKISFYFGPTQFSSLNNRGSLINSSLKNNEKSSLIGHTYGFNLIRHNKFFGIRFGLGISKLSHNTSLIKFDGNYISDYTNIVLKDGISNETINSNFINDTKIQLRQDVTYIEFPFEVYNIIYRRDKKFNITAITGITFDYLHNNSLILSNGINDLKIGKSNNLNKFNVTSQFGLGFNYILSNKIDIFVEPFFKFQVIPTKEYYDFIPYFLSVQTGISYKF